MYCYIPLCNNNYRLCIDWKMDFIVRAPHFKLNLEVFITKFVDKFLCFELLKIDFTTHSGRYGHNNETLILQNFAFIMEFYT